MTAAPGMPLIPNVIVGGGAWGRLPGKGSGAPGGWGLGNCGAPGGGLGFQNLQEVCGLSFLHPTAAVRQCMGPQPLEANTLYTPHSTHHPNPTHQTPHTPNPQDLA